MKDSDIMGSADLHARLCLSSCILAELLRQSPASVDIEQLVRDIGHPRDEVEQVCDRLYHNRLLQPVAGREGSWQLAGDPSSITLADLFSALLSPSSGRDKH